MKYILSLSIFISFSSSLLAQNKNYKIIYRHCFQSDTTKQLTDTIGQEATLIGNRNISSYNFSKYFGKRSTTGNNNFSQNFDNMFKQKQSGTYRLRGGNFADSLGNIVLHDKKTDSIHVRERLFEDYVLTTEKTPEIKWAILPEYKQINQYKCQKATAHFRGRDYTAWFTKEIPILDGPWKFCTLPGLVMDIQDAQNQVKIYAVTVEFPTSENVPAFQPLGKKIDMSEYYTSKISFMEKDRVAMEAVLQSQPDLAEGSVIRMPRSKNALYCIEKWADK